MCLLSTVCQRNYYMELWVCVATHQLFKRNKCHTHVLYWLKFHVLNSVKKNQATLLYVFLNLWLNWLLLQTFMTMVYLDSGMWSTDTFWKPPDRSDTPQMSERCRTDIGPRGLRSSTRGSKCVPRKRWNKSSAAITSITNWEVKNTVSAVRLWCELIYNKLTLT